jgi:hypothetical protein
MVGLAQGQPVRHVRGYHAEEDPADVHGVQWRRIHLTNLAVHTVGHDTTRRLKGLTYSTTPRA